MNWSDIVHTPQKLGRLVLAPSYAPGTFDSHAVDCPFLFARDGRFWMTYVGWDGIGYQTGLAGSDDLMSWEKEGLIIGRGRQGTVTEYNVAMTSLLRHNDLFVPCTLKRVSNHYVGTYHAYPNPGYEAGPAIIGLCYSDDLRSWEVGPAVLEPDSTAAWEAGGLYKSWLMEVAGTYYLFYNAKNRTYGPWIEQTGFATSTGLTHWERFPGNPVLPVGASGSFDDRFASDPCVLRHGDTWLLFYFGLCSDGHEREGFAVSQDLRKWQKSHEILIDVGAEGTIDSLYVHKPSMISCDGRLYHFYCAVAPRTDEQPDGIDYDCVCGIPFASA